MSEPENRPIETTGPFKRSERLLESKDFRRVMRRGRRRASRELVVITTPRWKNTIDSNDLRDSESSGSRLGITASRKFGGAVTRNRFKRQTREWFRRRRQELGADLDLVVIARPPAALLSFDELDQTLCQLLRLRGRAAGSR